MPTKKRDRDPAAAGFAAANAMTTARTIHAMRERVMI
jgi:hypothetical protein